MVKIPPQGYDTWYFWHINLIRLKSLLLVKPGLLSAFPLRRDIIWWEAVPDNLLSAPLRTTLQTASINFLIVW